MADDVTDVPSSIDLRLAADAATWADEADRKRPWRRELRRRIAELVRDRLGDRPLRILELGPGPGLLAEVVLATCAIERYTLLDFSPPFLAMCRERLGRSVDYVEGDFTQPDWPGLVDGPFDAVLAMQSVHELRHKRRVPALYAQIRSLLGEGGMLVVCDHDPFDDTPRMTSLLATEAEQHAALAAAGFTDVATEARAHGLYVCSGKSAESRW